MMLSSASCSAANTVDNAATARGSACSIGAYVVVPSVGEVREPAARPLGRTFSQHSDSAGQRLLCRRTPGRPIDERRRRWPRVQLNNTSRRRQSPRSAARPQLDQAARRLRKAESLGIRTRGARAERSPLAPGPRQPTRRDAFRHNSASPAVAPPVAVSLGGAWLVDDASSPLLSSRGQEGLDTSASHVGAVRSVLVDARREDPPRRGNKLILDALAGQRERERKELDKHKHGAKRRPSM